MNTILNYFSGDFMPHGMCYAWQPDILWLNVLSDGLIASAYLSIPIALMVFIKRRDDLEFTWMFRLFAAFIFWCAMTHVMGMWVVWNPDYAMQGLIKMITAFVSVTTAIMLWPLLPQALAIPSPTTLQTVNDKLREEISKKEQYQRELEESHALLERRVEERTRELKTLNEELARSNEELEEFAYAASHDLKEPLRGIKTYANYLAEKQAHQVSPEIMEKLQRIEKLSTRMQGLVDSLLEYSRLGSRDLAIRKVDMNELVQDIRQTIQVSLDEKEVQLNIQEDLPVIRCDPERMQQVVQNLLTNAIKYNNNEQIIIDLGVVNASDKPVSLPEGVDENDTVFYVRDNGIGIKEKHFQRIFRIFKRLHAEDEFGGGTGTGLTIVKRILERHGGTIWLESGVGKGSIFYFTLPGNRQT